MWATKTNEAFNEDDSILLYDGVVSGNNGYILAPDPAVYPYIYTINPDLGSTITYTTYAIDAMWVDAMGNNA